MHRHVWKNPHPKGVYAANPCRKASVGLVTAYIRVNRGWLIIHSQCVCVFFTYCMWISESRMSHAHTHKHTFPWDPRCSWGCSDATAAAGTLHWSTSQCPGQSPLQPGREADQETAAPVVCGVVKAQGVMTHSLTIPTLAPRVSQNKKFR